MERGSWDNEKDLLQKVQEGNRAAMRQLYDCFAGYAMAVCSRYIPDKEAVRDVVQDSFIKIFTTIGHFHYQGEGSLHAWIRRVVANTAISYLNKKELKAEYPVDILSDKTYEETESSIIDKISPELLTEMIAKLPMTYRFVLNLHVFEGFSHQEIARQLGIKENSSCSRFFRAKKMLAAMIMNYLKKNDDEG